MIENLVKLYLRLILHVNTVDYAFNEVKIRILSKLIGQFLDQYLFMFRRYIHA